MINNPAIIRKLIMKNNNLFNKIKQNNNNNKSYNKSKRKRKLEKFNINRNKNNNKNNNSKKKNFCHWISLNKDSSMKAKLKAKSQLGIFQIRNSLSFRYQNQR